jgi:hypothetical protein
MYVLSTYIIFWYGHRLFEYKVNSKISFAICFISNIVLWLLLIYFSNEIINGVSNLIAFIIIFKLAFKCDWKLTIFNSILLTAIMFISEYMILFLVSYVLNLEVTHFKNDLIIFIEEAFASKILFFILLIAISSFSKKNIEKEGMKTSIPLSILPITTFFMTIVLRVQSQYFESTTIATILCVIAEILLFIANVVVFSVHESSIASQKKLHDMEMVEQKQAINLEYLDILERKDEETRIFVHDIRNNLINISNLTDEENVKRYIQEIYNKSNDISVKAKTKNQLLDVIINKYYLLCKDKNIEFNILSINENLSFISDYDISAILDNLLRNAIESAEKENNPYISLSLESDNKFHKIILKNSCSTKPIEDKNNLITTKSNKSIHGYGMKSVIKALNNYNGELEWAYNDNEFKIIILIPA